MSAATHGMGEVGNDLVDMRTVESEDHAPTEAPAGDDWSSVLAVAGLLVALIVVSLILTGGN